MLIIPAIDIKNGQCVRLKQGRMEDATVYGEDPVVMAARWVEAGARRLHIVDLDGAFDGGPTNAPVIHRIAKSFPDLPIQVVGGIRNEETVEGYLEAGVRYVIIGTKAVNDPAFVRDLCQGFPGHVIVGLDANNGKVAVEGWASDSGHDLIEMAKQFEQDGVEAIVYTDIARDGMMTGISLESTVQLANAINIPIIASGGLTDNDDIRNLCATGEPGIIGAITGRAIYEGTLDLAEGQKLADELSAAGSKS